MAIATVPLVVYIGGERRIVGDAEVVGNEIHAHIAEGGHLERMISDGVISTVSVGFEIPPPDIEKF